MVLKMKFHKKKLLIAFCFLAAFILWTIALLYIDPQPIGPEDSMVGFAELNSALHRFTGVHFPLYVLTDWLSLIPLGICIIFAMTGLSQWVRRKSISKVDSDLLALGAFYVIVIAIYELFEVFIINYRPVLIKGVLEASYPPSTTMLVICVMSTAIMQFQFRIKNITYRKIVTAISCGYLILMITLRFLSGVHWFTDILGGILLSTALVMIYASVLNITEK
jgi:undecaprenyl-diphosphatase